MPQKILFQIFDSQNKSCFTNEYSRSLLACYFSYTPWKVHNLRENIVLIFITKQDTRSGMGVEVISLQVRSFH